MMKRWIGILILALLLTGCAVQEPTPSAPPEPTATMPSAPSDTSPTEAPTEPVQTQPVIDDSSPLNTMTPGADCDAVLPMGSNLLLVGKRSLAVWHLGDASAIASEAFSNLPAPGSGMLQVLPDQIVYFDANSGAMIYLNEKLQQTRKLQLNETVMGDAYLTADCTKLYFCTATGIRVWDLQTGICQNLMLQEGQWMGIHGALLSESALRCQLMQDDGTVRTLLISTQTGQTLYEGDVLNSITGCGQLYCYPSPKEWIFGLADQQPRVLQVKDAIPLPEISAAYTVTETDGGVTLELYDLASGLRSAALELPGITKLEGVTAFHNHIWFLVDGKLHRWDPALSPTGDETVYTAYRYTAETPDTEGLAAFQARADQLGKRYGIEILLWKDAAAAEPAGYTFGIEYRTEVYEEGFAILEAALAQFPDTLPARAADWTESGVLRIVLVSSITTPSETVYATVPGMEYLLDGQVYIVLELGENLERSFYHAFFHVIDPLIMSNSIAYYKWSDLNPSGFQYDNDYIANLDRDGSKYLSDDKRYFIDTYSMSYAVEDRARIFEYATAPGNESYFSSKYMQAKLKTLCSGLRDVFALEGESYLWEQYLQ